MTEPPLADLLARPLFFCGIGGSGMLPLACIARALGAEVAGSDRARDQGRTPEKFAWLESQGCRLFPQDGSGITRTAQVLVASAAVEDSVPEVPRAQALGCLRLTRAALLARLVNAAPQAVAVGGTSGKSTVTAMIGWVLDQAGRDPTIVNGAVMKNFADAGARFAAARVGAGAAFVAEADESDGSIALYTPRVAVLTNIGHDHKSLDELRALFGGFLAAARVAVVNHDDPEVAALAPRARVSRSFALDHPDADFGLVPGSIIAAEDAIAATLIDRPLAATHALRLRIPGRHNLANALAAIAATHALGVPVATAVAALGDFKGLARRFDILGASPSGIRVIDDFAHNPDKLRATLATLKAHPGRLLVWFQPHGYGPLRQMGAALAETFAALLDTGDAVILADPAYFGGTVDRSAGSSDVVPQINAAVAARGHGPVARHIPERDAGAAAILAWVRPAHHPTADTADRIVVMGARDDTLTDFARDLLARLP